VGRAVDRLQYVRVVQRGRRGAVGQRERLARQPAVVDVCIEDRVGLVELRPRLSTPYASFASTGRSASKTIACIGVIT